MTREEFEDLGITPDDLVCLHFEDDFKVVGGDLDFSFNGNILIMHNGDMMNNKFYSLAEIKSIEIIRKGFWSDNDSITKI